MEKSIIEHMSDISKKMRSNDKDRIRRGPCLDLSPQNYEKAEDDIAALRSALGMNTAQVLIMTAVLQNSARSSIDGNDIASFLGIEYLDFLTWSDDLEELKRRGYLRLKNDGDVVLPAEVMRALKDGKPFTPPKTTGLDTGAVLMRIRKLLNLRSEEMISSDELKDEVEVLVNANPSTSISKAYRKHVGKYTDEEGILFFATLLRYFCEDDDQVGWYNVDDLFDDCERDNLHFNFRQESLRLQVCGVLEFSGDDGIVSKEYFKIKDSVKDEALADAGGLKKKSARISASRKIAADSIRPKELFYNGAVQRQVGQLHELMGERRFAQIRSALKDKGLRTGFTCLFHGGPGTGKTETVYQLARECGRDLFVVDVSQVKSCWVGESEKNIKDVFTKYRASLNGGGPVPILLFNEADAIFGVRKEGAESAVDKMENSIQNIILQEMEDLDGILIATTNLTTNLDKAFERRFLYKVRFDKPSVEARSRIWTSMMPELSEGEAMQLATDFDFSGGQIENIARKRTVHELIDGTAPSFADIRAYCAEETLGETSERRRIGF